MLPSRSSRTCQQKRSSAISSMRWADDCGSLMGASQPSSCPAGRARRAGACGRATSERALRAAQALGARFLFLEAPARLEHADPVADDHLAAHHVEHIADVDRVVLLV